MVYSVSLLANHAATEPEWQGAAAFYAEVPISPKRSPASVRAVSQTYGFEPTLWRRTVWRSVHDVIESLLLGGLARLQSGSFASAKVSAAPAADMDRSHDAHSAVWRHRSTVALKPAYGECHLVLGL